MWEVQASTRYVKTACHGKNLQVSLVDPKLINESSYICSIMLYFYSETISSFSFSNSGVISPNSLILCMAISCHLFHLDHRKVADKLLFWFCFPGSVQCDFFPLQLKWKCHLQHHELTNFIHSGEKWPNWLFWKYQDSTCIFFLHIRLRGKKLCKTCLA